MARLSNGRCPKCGAAVPLDASDYAKCAYCGSTAFVQRTGAPPPADVPVIVVPSHAPVMLVLGLVVLGALVAAGAVFATAASRDTPPAMPAVAPPPVVAPQPPVAVSPPPKPEEEPEPPVLRVVQAPAPVFGDLDGDGVTDVVATVTIEDAASRDTAIAVFDGRTGALRARTPALELDSGAMVVASGGRIVLAAPNGQLTGYDAGSGDSQWTTTLGDRVLAICTGDEAGALLVTSADERQLAIDLVTGRQTESHARCGAVLAAPSAHHDPRDRHDSQAPSGVEAYRCGTVTVMGDANYRVPDACLARAHVDTDRLDGMVGHRLWKHERGWLVFGVRTPGTYVPMVGRLERGARFAWKTEVPATNPLEAQEGGPPFAALAGDAIVIGYDAGGDRRWRVTAFGVEDGVRRFDVALDAPSLHALEASAGRVYVHAGEAIDALDPANGAIVFSIGEPDRR